MLPEPIEVTLQVSDVFERLNIPYFIGGSLATAIHGVARATMDVDIIADIQLAHVESFVSALENTFYVDDEMIKEAIVRRSSFNIIHRETMFKVDIFTNQQRPFDQTQFERRIQQTLADEPVRTAYFSSAEDNILAKFNWYRMGGEVSERQWRDVINVMKIQRGNLDLAYLQTWAIRLKTSDLLEKALAEANP
ncbi:MAG: hypothetical protein HUU38_00170 [Anaerolineales bacterium]|nr:hypothetical protein [Anaerolineales bacterium]